ncbi:MAG: amidohydrolase [Arachnia sp.]
MTDVVIARARLLREFSDPVASELVDVTVRDGLVATVEPHVRHRLGAVDAEGATLLPGLWDEHVHFSTHALLAECLQLPAEADLDAILLLLRSELSLRNAGGLLVGFGYRGATWPVEPSAAVLDDLATEPIVLISGDLHSLWCNSSGLVAVGAPEHPTGLLREEEAFTAMLHLMATETGHVDALVRGAQRRAAALGVVGVVDMEMSWGVGAWQRRMAASPSLQHVEVATYPDDLERLIALGLRTGDRLGERLNVGPLKIISDGSLSSKTAHCLAPYPHPIEGSPHGVANLSRSEMTTLMARAHRFGISSAVHAIGDRACRDALDAFEAVGAEGTIEHAQLVHPSDLHRFASLNVGASVQPAHLIEDEAVLDEVWPASTDRAFALRALLDAGARLRFGSDAPVSPLDPWLAMNVAVNMPHRSDQALTPMEALAACTRTRIAVGEPADLVLTSLTPTQLGNGALSSPECQFTMVAGTVTLGTAAECG